MSTQRLDAFLALGTQAAPSATTALAILAGAAVGWAQDTANPTPAQPAVPAVGGFSAPRTTPQAAQQPRTLPAIPGIGSTPSNDPNTDLVNPFDRDETMAGADLATAGQVNVSDDLLVDLHVQDEDLGKILQLLSIQSQRNIIASQNVSARVTANLYNVTFYEALDAILGVNGYGYLERGNFIEVYTIEELIKITEQAQPLEKRVVRLNYISPADAGEFAAPLLSEKGVIKAPGKLEEFSLPDSSPVGAQDYALDSMIVIFDTAENIDKVEELLAQIDTRPQQVLIESTILQTTVNEDNAWGVDFSLLGSLDIGDFVGLSPVDGLRRGAGRAFVSPTPGSTPELTEVPVGTGDINTATTTGTIDDALGSTFKLGLIAGDFGAFVNALDRVTDTQIISRPNILTLNRQRARVLVGRKVGYLNTTTTQTASTQSVEFLDTGTQLHVRPIVGSDGSIRMELLPRVSEAVIRNVSDSSGAPITIPDEITNELTTNVLVRDGQTIVLGGLFRESNKNSRRQVPFLGDIPWVGEAFRGYDNEIGRNEIIFLVKPSLVNDTMLLTQAEEATAYINNVRTGAREGLLPWSREKQSAQLLVRAQGKIKDGDIDEALYLIQRSLSLNPAQPEAIEMRDALLNQKTTWPSRSFLEEVINGSTSDLLSQADVKGYHARRELAKNNKNDKAQNSKGTSQTATVDASTDAPASSDIASPSEAPTNDSAITNVEPQSQLPADGSLGAITPDPNNVGTVAPIFSDPRVWPSSTTASAAPAATTQPVPAAQPVRSTPPAARIEQVPMPAAGAQANASTNTLSAEASQPAPSASQPIATASASASGVVTQPLSTNNNQPTITLNVQNQDIRDVLDLISLATGATINVGEGVQGPVSASFDNATVEQALHQLTQPAGFTFAKSGDAFDVSAPAWMTASFQTPTTPTAEGSEPIASEPSFSSEPEPIEFAVAEQAEPNLQDQNTQFASEGDPVLELAFGDTLDQSFGLAGLNRPASDPSAQSKAEEHDEPSTDDAGEEPSFDEAQDEEQAEASRFTSDLGATRTSIFRTTKFTQQAIPQRTVTGDTLSSAVGNSQFASELLQSEQSGQAIDTIFDVLVAEHIWGSGLPAMTLKTVGFDPASSTSMGSDNN